MRSKTDLLRRADSPRFAAFNWERVLRELKTSQLTQVSTLQMEVLMKSLSTIAITVLLIGTSACLAQQVVGSTQLGVAYAELRDVTTGWSTKKQVLGKKVFNDGGETVGKIDDIIVSPDKSVSYAIIGAGGFLGVGRHDVAIPVNQLKENDGKFVLAGATKAAIKAMPEFEY